MQKKYWTKSGKRQERSISIHCQSHCFEIENSFKVEQKKILHHSPKIDSVVLEELKKEIDLNKDTNFKIINKIFSYKRKKISNILKQFGIEDSSDQRLDDLSTKEIVEIAKKIHGK